MNKEVASYYDNESKNTVVWSYETDGDEFALMNFLRFRCLDKDLKPIEGSSHLTYLTPELPKEHLHNLTHSLIIPALKRKNYETHLSDIASMYVGNSFSLERMN